MVRALLAAVTLAAVGLAGCGGSGSTPAPQTAPNRVAELTSVDSLRTAFARDEGHARLLLLLAPT
jgi:ABC-type glycerol-3-phosphate transport system substrate-binding protein